MNFDEVQFDAKEILDLHPGGWVRDPLFDMVKLTEEVGEVAECLTKPAKTKEDLGEELSDVIVCVGVIALRSGIDLNKACPDKQAKRVKKLLRLFHKGSYPSHVKRG